MKFKCIILCGIIASVYCDNYDNDTDPTQECKDFCILAMGLSGSGVFSTVQKLMSDQIQENETSIPTVIEYSWNVVLNDGKSCKIRIAVSPGQIEGRDLKHDAKTLATIKEYLENPSGLQGNSPSVVLVVSRFDDISADAANSKFVRLLKNVETLEPLLGYSGTNSNIIFHFTHLMGRNRNEVKNPTPVIQGFKNVIKRYTRLMDPVYVTIGENRPDDYQLPRRGAFIRLPNNELYPKNIIDEILRTLQARSDDIAFEVVQETFKNPNHMFSPQIKTFSVPDEPENEHPKIGSDEVTKSPNSISTTSPNVAQTSSTNFVPYTYTASTIETESEIDEDLRTAYDDLDKSVKQNNPNILPVVQNVFKRENITTRAHLPKTKLQTAALFQKLPFHTTTLALVQKAFQLQQPPFIHPTLVGYGYDILKDERVKASPFILKNLQPTPMGYSLPDIYMCTKENETFVETFKLVQSYEEFQQMWLKDLGIGEFSVNSSAFTGPVRSGYNNIKPDSDAFVAITAIQQIRNFKLKLILLSELDANFISDVNDLTPFNQHERESEREWNAFFRRYGTHVITEAFGGGYMEGKATGTAIRNNLNDKMTLYDIKDTLISFITRNISRGDIETFHSFFGGAPDAKMADMNKLPENERDNLFKEWKNSVRSDPRILDINIRLTPISEIASSVNETIGQEIQNSLSKLLQGNLVYQRRRNKPKSPTTDQTQNNRISSTTTKPPGFEQSSNRFNSNETPKVTTNPPVSVRNNSPKKEYNKNVIGQGYHILKDSVLPNSPFCKDIPLKTVNRVKVQNYVDVKAINDPCVFIFFKKFSSFSDYVKDRIYSIYKPTAEINLDVDQYGGSTKPGYNVIDGDDDGDDILSVYKEQRHFQVTADLGKFNLSSEFLRDVNKLQSYNNNVFNCTIMEQWRNFFGEYGTHVVKAGYAGTWTESREAGRDTRMIERKIGSNLDTCESIRSANACNYDVSSFHPKVAIHSATLETMKNAVGHFKTPWSRLINHEYHMVMVALLENRCG